jgi:LemA protein
MPLTKRNLESVTRARNQAVGANSLEAKEAAEKNLNQAMMNLFAVAEQYPDLKANANFQQLQAELTSIENDIEKSRRYYNGTARENNTLVESFPSNIVANMFISLKRFPISSWIILQSEKFQR